jgi:hypothetical protein
MTTVLEYENEAERERTWSHTVGISNRALGGDMGIDPYTKLPGTQEQAVGTGLAGVWGGHRFILTAKHVLDKATVSDLDFFVRQTPSLKTQHQSQVTMRDAVEPEPLKDRNATIHSCSWEDLAIVKLTDPDAFGPMVEYFDIGKSWSAVRKGVTVFGVGYPVSYGVALTNKIERGVVLPNQRVGNLVRRSIILWPVSFNGEVLPRPSNDAIKFKFRGFDSERHFLFPYEHTLHGYRPEGISGAAVWVLSKEHHQVWAPRFKFAGTCTSCNEKGDVEWVVKASTVRRFLTEVFGPIPKTKGRVSHSRPSVPRR